MKVIEEEAGLKGKLLRPLSARLLRETEVEKKGIVDRTKLLEFSGEITKAPVSTCQRIWNYPLSVSSGGCLLTCEEYSKKLRDLLTNKKRVSMAESRCSGLAGTLEWAKTKSSSAEMKERTKVLAAEKQAANTTSNCPT